MAEWLSKVMSKVGMDGGRAAVREALQTALRNRCKVYIESPDQGVVALTQVQQIEGDEIVIAVPSIGGLTYPLAFGEAIRISLVNERVNLAGHTRCLGRVKVPAGGGRTLFAYRIALPDSLEVEERRADPRVDLPPDIAPSAHLYSGRMPGPIEGRISSLSMSGARFTTSAPLRGLAVGHEVYLKFMLPEPVGLVDEVIEVSRIDSDPGQGVQHIGVSFHRRLERLSALMRPVAEQPSGQQHRRAG